MFASDLTQVSNLTMPDFDLDFNDLGGSWPSFARSRNDFKEVKTSSN